MRSIESQRKENEMTFDIVHSVAIETTPDRLYEAITTQKGLAGWLTPQVKAEPTVGALNEFHFARTTFKFRVEKLEPARHVAWSSVQVSPPLAAALAAPVIRGHSISVASSSSWRLARANLSAVQAHASQVLRADTAKRAVTARRGSIVNASSGMVID
jgi:uncharacterized protein YndB with AHSA1/START domain